MLNIRCNDKWIPYALFGGALGYYYALSSKIFTWIYVSGDAGDWLLHTNWWLVSHPFGKPLYTAAIHALNVLPLDPIIRITFFLSVIPGAIIIALVYLIAKELTHNTRVSVISALVCLGAVIPLSQATVLEQYAFTAVFFVAAYYFYLRGRYNYMAAMLGLATATHIVGAILTGFWFVLLYNKERRGMIGRAIGVYLAAAVLPYLFLVWMSLDPTTPKIFLGSFSWGAFNSWGGNPTSSGALALVESPDRLRFAAQIFAVTFGVAWIPYFISLKRPWAESTKVMLLLIGYTSWFFVTNLFPSTWKYLYIPIPVMAAFVGLGLTKLPAWHSKVVLAGACVLIVANGFWFNSNTLAHEKPLAVEYMEDVHNLPDGAAVLTPRGGAYGFATYYAISQGKDLIPIALSKPPFERYDRGYLDYLDWQKSIWTIEGENCVEQAQYALDNDIPLYFAKPPTDIWGEVFYFGEDAEIQNLPTVIGINPNPDWERFGIVEEDNADTK